MIMPDKLFDKTKTCEVFEKRMYFFVPYNISPIQQGIQSGHAALEYARKYQNDPDYMDFIDNWKTWVILNGGTTNRNLIKNLDTNLCDNLKTKKDFYVGSLDNIASSIIKANIKYGIFFEPDLNNALTAICFIADERVWNYKDYPNFFDYVLNTKTYLESLNNMVLDDNLEIFNAKTEDQLKEIFPEYYKEWVDFMGGETNIFLRELIKGKKLV